MLEQLLTARTVYVFVEGGTAQLISYTGLSDLFVRKKQEKHGCSADSKSYHVDFEKFARELPTFLEKIKFLLFLT